MSEATLSRIRNLIKVEDDLLKIEGLRLQYQKEKTSIDIKLNSTTKQHIDSFITNLEKLKTSAQKINSVKASLDKIDSIYTESITNVKEYETIKNVSSIHQLMMQIQNLYTDIANYRQFLDHINNMIDAELNTVSEDIEYPLMNIFRIHYNVTQARNFQEYLEEESKHMSDDVQSIVQKIITPSRKVIRNFEVLLKEIIISITEAVKEGNTAMVLKLVQIIKHESEEDVKVTLLKQLHLVNHETVKTMNYSTFRAGPRNYKKFFYATLEESLAETFTKCVEHFYHDKMLVYDNLDWLEDELVFVARTLDPLFPSEFEISDFIQNVYYNKLHKFTMNLINTNPPAEDLMRILAYDTSYSNLMSSLGDGKKKERSILGEDLKASVLEDYLKVIVMKMEEWNKNLMEQESQAFTQRDEPPDVYSYQQSIDDFDEYNHLITTDVTTDVFVLPDFKVTLSMLKEQADVAADSGYGKVLVGVIENWAVCYNNRVDQYMHLVETEVTKYMSVYNNEKYLIKESKTRRFLRLQSLQPEPEYDVENMTPEELAKISKPGIVEYLTGLGNTYEINTDRLQEKFLPNYKSKVHSSYQERIEQAFQDTILPSTDLNALVIRSLSDIIVNDLLPALSTVFTKPWYDSSKSQTAGEPTMALKIVETMVEYMEELKGYASYDLFVLTFTVTLDTFVARYLSIGYQNILHGDGKKIDPTATKKFKSFSEAVSRDVGVLYGGLDHLLGRKDAVYLMKSLSAIEFLGGLAMCENPLEEIPYIWEHEILDMFYYCSVEYVRGIVLCRKDIDAKMVPALIERLLDIQKKYQASVDPPEMAVNTLTYFKYQ